MGTPRNITPGQIVVAAYDFDGQQVWLTKPGGFISAHGFCSNPVVYENLVIVNGDHDGDSYIVALDKATGKTVWTVPRQYGIRSYVTPLIRDIDGRTQMVFSGSKHIVSLTRRTDRGIGRWKAQPKSSWRQWFSMGRCSSWRPAFRRITSWLSVPTAKAM